MDTVMALGLVRGLLEAAYDQPGDLGVYDLGVYTALDALRQGDVRHRAAPPDRPGEPEGLNAWLAANDYRLITVEMLAGYLNCMEVLRTRPPIPTRGDDVERWLKRYRDAHSNLPDTEYADNVWRIVDDLLSEYRLHADTGTPLDQEVAER